MPSKLHLPTRLSYLRSSSYRGSSSSSEDATPHSSSANTTPGRQESEPPGPSPAKSTTGMASHNNHNLMLKVGVIKARNLAPKDKHKTSDPYLVLTLGEARHSTICIPKNLNPEWNETIELPVEDIHSLLLEVKCWDKDRFKKDYMGEFDIALEDVFVNGAVALEPRWYPLQSRRSGRKSKIATGEVLLELSLYDPIHMTATPQHLQQKLLGMVAAAPDLVEDEDDLQLDALDTEDLRDLDDSDAESPDSEQRPPGQVDLEKTTTNEKHKRRLKLARLKKKAKERAYEFSGMSDMAGVLFLEIQKVTDLPPEKNMIRTGYDMDPFVVTSLGKKTYKTKVIRHNLNPVYEEKLVFQVLRHETQYSLSFTVMDRDKLSGNDVVATCNFPVDKVASLAPKSDHDTGLFVLKDPQPFGPPMSESKKSRFRIPLSRSSSTNSLQKVNSHPRNGLSRTDSSSSLMNIGKSYEPPSRMSDASKDKQHSTSESLSTDEVPRGSAFDTGNPEDPDLRGFVLPLTMKHKEKWEEKNKPQLYIRAKYLPYKALRQQFWRAMLKQYDADESGSINQVELTTMLDSLGSTLHEQTIDDLFTRFQDTSKGPEAALTTDQAVMCLEDLLERMENKKKTWQERAVESGQGLADRFKRTHIGGTSSPDTADEESPSSYSLAQNFDENSKYIPALEHPHHGTSGEQGDHFNAATLADDDNEEHVVEIRECPICHQPRMSKKSDSDIITHIATCASQDWRQVNNIMMAGFVTSSQAQRKWYSKVVTRIGYGGYKLGKNSANILVQDRLTGQINEERMSVYVRLGIRLLYKGLKSNTMEKSRIRKLLKHMSIKQGRKYDDPDSAAEIRSFINFHQLDMSEVLQPVESFRTFNEFFYRKLKPTARPCSAPERPEIITSPADCRSVVFNKIEDAQTIWVKGREFSVERLLGKAYPEDAKRYKGGSLGIFRLAPQDYHRFHVPVDGMMDEPKVIDGEYYTVNPMAIRSALDVYGENVRVVVPIDSERHGRVMVICVGAMMVGSTVITRKKGERVKRAEELGYFKFGGSTLLLLFPPSTMRFDPDLIDNSKAALETLLTVGMSIGHSPNVAPHGPDMLKNRDDLSEADFQMAKRRISGSLAPSSAGLAGMLPTGWK